MDPLDPDSSIPPYRQIVDSLAKAIDSEEFGPGEQLPSQKVLSEYFGVARATIQTAIKELTREDRIVSRQGSGVFVRQRTRPIGLRPHIELAFTRPNVQIDFSGYTGETLHNAIQEPLDEIRHGTLSPKTIQLRLLLADMAHPIALPSRAGDDPGDDERVRRRMAKTIERYAGGIQESLAELTQLGHVDKATAEIRVHSAAPQFKLYLLNSTTVFFGFYPVVRHDVAINGETVPTFDPMGKDVDLIEYGAEDDPEALADQYIAQAKAWFDSVWTTIARPRAE